MTEEELNDARLLWKMFYAWESFRKVQQLCDYVLKQKIAEDHPAYYSLITSIYIFYGRPFHKSRGVGRLTDDIVPKEHMKLHKAMLTHRDSIYAHTDADGPDMGEDGLVNQVRIIVKKGIYQMALTQFKALPAALKDISTLCKALQTKTDYHIAKIRTRTLKLIPSADGEFFLNVRGIDQPFVSKAKTNLLKTT